MFIQTNSFHQLELAEAEYLLTGQYTFTYQTKISYSFYNHFHPFVGKLIERLNKGDIKDLLASDLQIVPEHFFENTYTINPLQAELPEDEKTIEVNAFPKTIDLEFNGPYSIYNWELFFHIPLTIAVHLSKNQRYADAQRWFHFIFDPTTDEAEDPANPTARYWKFKHFREKTDAKLITELLELLSMEESGNEEMESMKKALQQSIDVWRANPFRPHQVAKFRPLAYQFNVVMKYLDNLIAWGDSLFRQFTMETHNEATQIYILAANILGERPQEIPRSYKRPVRTYKEIKDKLDEFSNLIVEMENEFPLNSNVPGILNNSSDSSRTSSLLGIARQLYFCVPENKKLLSYWDVVSDRLFKLRHCMDIEGNVRPLPLFQPPIDPGMLVKAAAAGIDLSSVIGGLNQPVSNVRFTVILQKALELCNEVKTMGSALLAAIEKGDAEKLALIRQEHEIKILELTQDVKFLQWKDAEAATKALLKTRESAYQRYRHFQLILGKSEGDFSDLEELTLESIELTEDNFEDVYGELVTKYDTEIDLEEYREEKLGLVGTIADNAPTLTEAISKMVGADDLAEHLSLNKGEEAELNVYGPLSTEFKVYSWLTDNAIAPLLALIPQFKICFFPFGGGGETEFGGEQLSKGAEYLSVAFTKLSEISNQMGSQALKLAGYQRRLDDWILQNNLAAKELEKIGRQVINSLIREQITKKEYENHKTQLEQSRTIDTFLKEQKYSNEELYLWMQDQISKVYYDCYKLAFDTAKKAEVTMKHELMRKELDERDFVKFNYWDAGRKGLLSGDSLFLDLKRMELAYLESNKREFEITKHISLQQLNPVALLQLKETGSCEVEIPEWVFDLDCPGHYMRRIKAVGVSIPCVTGPYTSVNCTLSLHKSTIRLSPLLKDEEYARQDSEDDRFRDYYGTIQSIVTSSAQNDNGLFEVNLRDERFLPFEGAGAESVWKIELPSDLKQFDYNTITDVIIHMRYTARQDGRLKEAAVTRVEEIVKDAQSSGLTRLFSLKHDFPNEWHQFINSDEDFKTIIKKEYFPYLAQSFEITINKIELFSIKDDGLKGRNIDLGQLSNNIFNANSQGVLTIPQDTNVLTRDKDEVVFLVLSYSLA